MVHAAADLAQFIQRREILAYEQRVARAAYAYGVDLRRSAWLDASTVGESLLREVDRRWNTLTADLSQHRLAPLDAPIPTLLLDEIVRIRQLLRAPVPALRLFRTDAQEEGWPCVLPLGTTKGAVHWLILDERLMQLPASHRAFALGWALGHLQCDHGPLFTATLLAARARLGRPLWRRLLSPWSKVAAFSADRAGLIAVGNLEDSLVALRSLFANEQPLFPLAPPLALREQALQDFDRSSVVTRLRYLQANPVELPPLGADAPKTNEARTTDTSALDEALRGSWSLTRCDERLTRKLGLL